MGTATTTALRDLSEEEFFERYQCDRFSATVLTSRFGYIVENMCDRVLTSTFSPILRDFYDFAATLTSAPGDGYQTPAISASLLLFTGTMADAVRNTVEEFGVERLEPGDVLVANDPYRIGTHVNDVLFVMPVFRQERIVGFVNLKAHQLDLGGIVPGGYSITKKNVYETGLVLSPRLLMKGGEPVAETWSLIFDNARFAEILAPDLLTVVAELQRGRSLLEETVDRYGAEAVSGAMAYVCDASAERMTQALETIPDGDWTGEDCLDCDAQADDEEYALRVAIRKRGGQAEVDFSGTSRQARTSLNATPLDVKTAVNIAFMYLFDPKSWITSGTSRPIDIVLPEGTMVSALPPDGAVFTYWEQTQVMISAILQALAPAVGANAIAGDRGSSDNHNANGQLPDGTPWLCPAQVGGEIGPFGANRHGDADSQMFSYVGNGIAPAVEAVEAGSPVVVLRHEIVPDSAGAGKHRGGASMLRDSLWLTAAEHHLVALRYKRAGGFGVNGGADGRTGGIWAFEHEPGRLSQTEPEAYRDAVPIAGLLGRDNLPDPQGTYHCPYRVPVWQTEAYTLLRIVNSAGGGWENPKQRDPERVRWDVQNGYLTIAGAARDYGVVVHGDPEDDPEGLTIDEAATARLRGVIDENG